VAFVFSRLVFDAESLKAAAQDSIHATPANLAAAATP
jgi:hypothetical protein